MEQEISTFFCNCFCICIFLIVFFVNNNLIFGLVLKGDVELNSTEGALREGLNGKKMFSFGHCPNKGEGVSTHARIFWPPFFAK